MKYEGSPDAPLSQVKVWLRERFEEGTDCPCCHQHVKLYKRKLTSSMAAALILVSRGPKDWLHVPSYLNERTKGAIIRGGDWAKLKHWSLLADWKKDRGDGSSRNGFWRITDLGRTFVRGEVRIPKYVYLYNQEVVSWDGDITTTNIHECLGERFNYAELMSA